MGEQEGEEEERKRREPTFPVLSTDFTHIISSDLHVGLGGSYIIYRQWPGVGDGVLHHFTDEKKNSFETLRK